MGEDAGFSPYRSFPRWRSGSGRSDGRKVGRECARVCGFGRCGGKRYRRFAEHANLPFHKTFGVYLTSTRNRMAVRPPPHPSFLLQKLTHPPSTRSRTIRNPTSARVSVPALLLSDTTPPESSGDSSPPRPWRWRTDLAKTQPFWQGWFVGLSKKFLQARGGKLLILAGTDRLDRELTIGQMQGKYQLVVLPEVGHFLHEDAPAKTAGSVSLFHLFSLLSGEGREG